MRRSRRRSQRCTAHNRRGEACQRWAIVGGTVCPTHGGSIHRVKATAEQRFRDLVHPAITALEKLVKSGDIVAVKYVLDYAGFKMADKVQADGNVTITVEYVNAQLPTAARHNGHAVS